MADVFSARKRSAVMAAIRSKGTKPEMRLRSALHQLGYRYSLHDRTLPGCPDIVMRRRNAAIQVRGCFWHGHTCHDGHVPKSRRDYWMPKLTGNRKRDARNDRALRRQGWKLFVVWECQCMNAARLRQQLTRISRSV